MAELEVDQSHLPRVQEVCQSFAVLEDKVLAHSLQEQEIEQYYTTNIQKNQLVQNDIRVAKRLQDEEEEQRAQHSTLLSQASRQEEQDFEYARLIQEEIQRHAEEARRRELDDEELAKQMQEEEERRIRRSRGEGSSSGSELTSPQQHAHYSPHAELEQYSPTTSRWQCSTSNHSSQCNGPQAGSLRGAESRKNPRLRSSEGQRHSFREESRELSSEDSDGPDTVFLERSSVRSHRLNNGLSTVPHPRQSQERNYRSFPEHCEDWRKSELDENYYEHGYLERRRARNLEYEGWHSNRDQESDSRLAEVREKRCSRTESVRYYDRSRDSFREAAKTWAYRENPDKHVRFQDNAKTSHKSQNRSRQVWEMLGQVLKERGVPVRLGVNGAPLQIGPQRRDSQVLYGSEVSCSDTQPHQSGFQRAATSRHSFHGNIQERRGLPQRNSIRRDSEGQNRLYDDRQQDRETSSRDSFDISSERRGSRRWKEHKNIRDGEKDANEHRIRRTTSERQPSHRSTEQSLSLEEEREVERPDRRVPQRSQSLSSGRALVRHRSRHVPAERDRTSLQLGELQQVLLDEEIARKLQEEEEKHLSRNPQPSAEKSSSEGDFKVAQVAQDEEIARYIQKQEIKSKRRSRELEGPVSWREHRAMLSQHDGRTRERQIQRQRLDSEGLPSPTEDCSPENEPHSPVSALPPAPQIRNIAEELDPTFHARRQDTDSLRVTQTGSTCQPLPVQHSGFPEPTFIPPTKRQADKSVRPKSKEKRENCKQQ